MPDFYAPRFHIEALSTLKSSFINGRYDTPESSTKGFVIHIKIQCKNFYCNDEITFLEMLHAALCEPDHAF